METTTEKTVNMIKSFFDSIEWKYELKEDKSTFIFNTGYAGQYEEMYVRIIVWKNRNATYCISCATDTILPQQDIKRGVIAVNRYNMKGALVCACLNEENGDIFFWRARDSNETISEEDFKSDFDSVLKTTDNDTAQILKDTFMMKDDDESNSKHKSKGLFRRFF